METEENREPIDPTYIHDALRSSRNGQRVRTSPLLALPVVQQRLATEGWTDSTKARGLALRDLLFDVIRARAGSELFTTRGHLTSGSVISGGEERSGAARITQDEAWQALRQRYAAREERSVKEVADSLGVGRRTLFRRLDLGYELLAQALQRMERTHAGLAVDGDRKRPTEGQF